MSGKIRRLRKYFVSILVMVLQTVVMAGPTAEEVLDKCTKALDETYSSFITQAKSHVQKQQKFSGAREYTSGEENKFLIQEFRTDGNRMKVISQQWGDTYNNQKRYFRPKSKSNYQVDIYDGDKRYEHVRAGKDPGTLIVHTEDAKKSLRSISAQIAQKSQISQCFGYMRGDLERFDRIIREGNSGKMTVKKEELNGTIHYVIDAETDRGKYQIWINPEKGYNFSKAIHEKNPGDLYRAGYKLPIGMEQRSVVENTEFKEIDGLWVPVKAISKVSDKYPNGGYLNGTQNLELTTIQINPDHDALNSFSLDGIKDGAIAQITGVLTEYYWRNGELIPNIDKDKTKAEAKKSGEKKKDSGRPTVKELLNKYAETADKAFSSFVCKSKSVSTTNEKFVGKFAYRSGKKTIHFQQEVRFDGIRVKRIDQHWGEMFKSKGFEYVPESKKGCYVDLFDGKKRYEHNRGPVSAGYVIIGNETPFGNRFGKYTAPSVPGATCLGYLKGDYKRFDQILKEAGSENVSVQEKMEEINGTAHYVIDADTENGKYRIWLNPEKGYNFTKAILRKNEGDAFNYGPLPSGNKLLFLMENKEFRKIDGVWVPVKASMKYNYKLPDGGYSNEEIDYEVTSISINPDHDTLGSFLTDDIRDGAKALLKEAPGAKGAKYVWQGGTVVDADGKKVDLEKISEEMKNVEK